MQGAKYFSNIATPNVQGCLQLSLETLTALMEGFHNVVNHFCSKNDWIFLPQDLVRVIL